MSNVNYSGKRIIAVLSFAALILMLSGTIDAAAQDIVIVVNKGVKAGYISSEDLAAIFLGNKKTWDTGENVVFAVYDDAAAQKEFMQTYIRKSPAQFKNYWKKMVFTGKGRMPKFLQQREDVLEFVSTNPGAISFLPDSGDNTVKTLNVR